MVWKEWSNGQVLAYPRKCAMAPATDISDGHRGQPMKAVFQEPQGIRISESLIIYRRFI